MISIAIDAMGGDFGPSPICEGTIKALNERDFKAILVGNTELIKPLIPSRYLDRVTFVEASDVLSMSDSATDRR